MFMERKNVGGEKKKKRVEHSLTTLKNTGRQLKKTNKKNQTHHFIRNRIKGLNPCSGPETCFKSPGHDHRLD